IGTLFAFGQRRKRQIEQPVIEREQPAGLVPIAARNRAKEHAKELSPLRFGRCVLCKKGLTEPARLAQNDLPAGQAVKRQAVLVHRPKPGSGASEVKAEEE